MTDEERNAVAVFRHGLIAPLVNKLEEKKSYLARICAIVHDVPFYGKKEFAPKTLAEWLTEFRKGGINALRPKGRNDKGVSRCIIPELKDKILEERKKYLELSVTLFYDKLVNKGMITPETISYYAIYRLLRREQLLSKRGEEHERKRFSYDKINVLWQGDMSVGPYLIINKRKVRTYLFAFIDDCSRLVPAAVFSYNEKFEDMRDVFKSALLQRGLPSMVYVDNGKVYWAKQLQIACAELGVALIHTKPYDPKSKGKIERFFSTVRKRFYPLLNENMPICIEDLNKRFWQWLESDYHRKVHSSIEKTPFDAFMAQANTIKMVNNPEHLDFLFLRRVIRKVRQDATIALNSCFFEVPQEYIGQQIEIRFDKEISDIVYGCQNGIKLFTAKKVIFADNAKMKRNGNISFLLAKGGE